MNFQTDKINKIMFNTHKVVKSKTSVPMNKVFQVKSDKKIKYPNNTYENIDALLKKEKLERVIRKYKR
jgi:hypothetical protein